jgi:hypothetical protein
MIIAETNSGGSYTPVPAGMWLGRCYRIIDLGTQKTEYQGSVKFLKKLMVQWEVHGEDEHGKELRTAKGEPLSISKNYTVSLAEKATLRKDLVSWRGKEFTSEELRGFDLKNILGAWAMLSVATSIGNNGKEYTNVVSVNPVPAAMKKNLPQAHNSLEMFDLEDPDMTLYESFSKNIKDRIEASPEWAAITSGKEVPKGSFDDMSDDIPF